MIENRQIWLEANFAREGGFVDHPEDNGGATNMGITITTLGNWRGKPVTVTDVKELSRNEATDIYMARFWNAIRGDQLPSGLDIYVADIAVNSGPARAAKLLQTVVQTEADGFIGPKTIEACRGADTLTVLLALDAARREFLLSLDDWPVFGKGWMARCGAMLTLAKGKIEKRPVWSEMAGSWTAWLGGGVTLAGLAPLLMPFVEHATGVATDLSADLTTEGTMKAAATALGGLLVIARRFYDWRTAKR